MLADFIHNIMSGDDDVDDKVHQDKSKPNSFDCYSTYTPKMSEFTISRNSPYYYTSPPCRHSTSYSSSLKVKEKSSHPRNAQKNKSNSRGSSTLTKSIAVITLAIMLFGGSGIQFATSQQFHPQNVNYSPNSVDSESISESLVDIDPLVSVPEDLDRPANMHQESSPSFSMSPPTVRAVSQRSSSEMSPNYGSENGGSESGVHSQYGNCRRYGKLLFLSFLSLYFSTGYLPAKQQPFKTFRVRS